MHDALPERLRERTRVLNAHPPGTGPVVYWMRTALRAEENPALEVAIRIARESGRSLWVYLGLSERYRYASDRHHRFILEGMTDVARALRQRGIASAVHVERPGHRPPVLSLLAAQSGVLITEEMPVAPLRQWTRALADSVSIPVWAVDAATVVPMRVVGPGLTRAFQYRKRIAPLLDRYLEPVEPEPVGASELPSLPFTPVDLDAVDLGDLLASCAIDHSVPPVADTRGGTVAGMARWAAFRDERLGAYAKARNSPTAGGASRMSAYLHYGMVAPTILAREAADRGADKYVDELVVWRELAYTWCLYAAEHESLDALPQWARGTLLAHSGDPRPWLQTEEALEHGTTGERLWDLAQQSLLRWGELHNNVRMTWGKALIPATSGPREALRQLVDLNHRYALDGRDPGSYGGLLWCLGLFDRPFPEQPILGTVRGRSVGRAAARVDLERYAARIQSPRNLSVGVIGAGLSGAVCAHILANHGAEVTVFDKSRGAGGRTSCRRGDGMRWSHGAPELTLTDPRLDRWRRLWRAGPLATGQPTNALCKHLMGEVPFERQALITDIEADGARWQLRTADGPVGEPVDAVVCTAPAPQTRAILGATPLTDLLESVTFAPRWVVLVDRASAPDARHPDIERVTGGGRAWVITATEAWTRAHLEDLASSVAAALTEAAGCPGGAATAHRWRYAHVLEGLDTDFGFDPLRRWVVAGDAFAGGGANGALLSGMAAAGRLLGLNAPA